MSFRVFKKEIFVIMGASGCGKSTLLRMIIGLQQPEQGRIIINGLNVYSDDDKQQRILRKNVGVLFQSDALFTSMTVNDNLALPVLQFTNLSLKTVDKLVRLKLGIVELSGQGQKLPSELSGGMRKRAALARAIVLDPSFLFLDEPTTPRPG